MIVVASGRERALLLLLLLHAPRPVSTDGIMDALWPSAPPESAVKVVQNYVLRLRKALGHDAVATVPAGYMLVLDGATLDAARAAALFARGHEALAGGAPDEADRLIDEGLSLFRGEPLADVRYEDFARAEITRLNEMQLAAVEDQYDARLQLGKHTSLVSHLEQRVERWPLRERLRGQLMLALYRSGRQADALAVYRKGHEALAEHGLEPTRVLRDLESEILNQDPVLDLPPSAGHDLARRTRSRSLMGVAGGLAALAAVGAGAYWFVQPASGRSISSLPADSVARVDPGTGRVDRWFSVGNTPTAVALSPGALWVTSFDDRTVIRIDLSSGRQEVAGTPSTPTGIAADGAGVWVIGRDDGTIERLDEAGVGVLAVLRTRPGLTDVTVDREGVWVSNAADGTLTRVDPQTNEVVSTLAGLTTPTGVALGAGRVWVAEAGARRVDAIDPSDGRIDLRIPLKLDPAELTFGDGALWATNPRDGTVTRIDPRSGVQQLISVGTEPSHVAVANDYAWVTVDRDHTILKINGRTGRIERRLQLADASKLVSRGRTITPGGLATAGGSVWLSVQGF
jgi:DNA-binding SARP family transcriptional activator/DNA-binding beta-propeller fold protein YncE